MSVASVMTWSETRITPLDSDSNPGELQGCSPRCWQEMALFLHLLHFLSPLNSLILHSSKIKHGKHAVFMI